MFTAFILLLAGLAMLVIGGELLVRGAVSLADRLGVSALIVSIVIIGFGTSAPELAASIEASRVGAPAIAWGNVVGSNLANSLLILGATALLSPIAVERGPLWRDGGVVLLATFLLWLFAADAVVGSVPGLAMLLLLFTYLGYAIYQEREKPATSAAADVGIARGPALEERLTADTPVRDVAIMANMSGWAHWKVRYPIITALVTLVIGLSLILFGGRTLVAQAVELASAFGLGEALIGVTVIAFGTSAPELVTSMVAARKGEGEIAIGNVLGSNIYNILGIGGVVAVIAPGGFPAELVQPDLPILVMSAIALMLCAVTHYRVARSEGFFLLSCYLGYIAWKVIMLS